MDDTEQQKTAADAPTTEPTEASPSEAHVDNKDEQAGETPLAS